ncbi:BLUF domain-containing protein [Paracoccus spongiarum]|uniref:BLUF domain-containing protein n=1 Tax=Paracoccus spongiarum TaxID=3064387 RepID=A0ABT9JEM0_9RHOB|nr:BLUF domain-containing protein [Paracoccus sp. 2205BS29-5]MDP5308085.1 BLUF domain-containing protein [Paracoccus sp. 2205BS29-5]
MINDVAPFDGLGHFLYRSTAVEGLNATDLEAILTVARERNGAAGLTGCLHHEDGLFFQWLEGPAVALRPVVEAILRDTRHRDITVLNEGQLDRRRFQDWRMRFSDRDQASLLDWFATSKASTVDRGDYAGGVVAFLQALAI